MEARLIESMLPALEARLDAFAVCEIRRGWRLTARPMESVVLHFVLKGDGLLEVGGRRIAIGRGMLVVTPAGVLKSYAALGDVKEESPASESCAVLTAGLARFEAGSGEADLVLGCASVRAVCAGGRGLFDRLEGSAPAVLSEQIEMLLPSAPPLCGGVQCAADPPRVGR